MIIENIIERFLSEAPLEKITPSTVIFKTVVNGNLVSKKFIKTSYNLSSRYDSVKSLMAIGALLKYPISDQDTELCDALLKEINDINVKKKPSSIELILLPAKSSMIIPLL
ncbi:hypothetical protein Glove_629g22 [Diversispora epigaea]|uniref:Uncharacterized protein n=1 Tax=Diversispora epigaea TaxID=1348612 RepID=A0A397G872_9GLOM|nr:hypothetical protein Glove_629g22 [Diversispora epigaea]